MAPEPLYLTILRHGETIAMDLTEENPVVPRSHIPVEERFLTDICDELARITTLANTEYALSTSATPEMVGSTDAFLNALKGLGRLIFAHLFPEPIRERLSHASTTDLLLRLDDQLVHVPWELAFDGGDFLITKFRIGRQVLTQHRLTVRSERRKQDTDVLHMLIIADPTENLPAAAEEAERLCTILDECDNLKVSVIGGQQVRKIDLLQALNDCDLVHYAGHAFFDTVHPNRSGWVLHDAVLTSSELSCIDTPPLLVFANACQAGVTTQWQSDPTYEGQAFGIGSAFLLAGTKNYIGTFWVMHDALSAAFAADFYRHILLGESVGEALYRTRQKALHDAGWSSLLWASYMHYGNPAFRLPIAIVHETTTRLRTASLRSPEAAPSTDAGPGTQLRETGKVKDTSQTPRRQKSLLWYLGGLLLLGVLVGLGLLWGSHNQDSLRVVKPASEEHPFLSSAPHRLLEYQQAYADFSSGKVNAALAAFKKLTEAKDSPLGLGYDGIAAIYFEGELTEKAQRMVTQALEINPDHAMAHLLQGDIHYTKGEMDKALNAYHLAAEAQSFFPWQQARAYNAIGVLYSLQGMQDKAVQQFTKAVSIDAGFHAAYDNLGYVTLRERKPGEAKRHFDKARALHPDDAMAGYYLMEIARMTAPPRRPAQVSSDMPRLSILPFALAGGNIKWLGEGETVAGLLATYLHSQNSFDLVERSTMQRLLAEKRIGFSRLADSIAALNLGKLLKADIVIYGSYQSFENTFALDARAVDVQTTEVLTTAHIKTNGKDRIRNAAQDLGRKLRPLLRKEKLRKERRQE